MGRVSGKDSYQNLSKKQEIFIDNYMAGKPVHECVTNAGYTQQKPDMYGKRLLQLPSIKQEVERRSNEITREANITKKSQLEDLQRLKGQFERLMELINKSPSERSEDEKQQIKELKEIFKLRDIERILDQQNKLLNLYEADQLEVTHTIKVDLIGDGNNNNNIQDVEHEEV